MKAEREEWFITYKGTPKKLSVDFTANVLQAKKECNDILKVLKEKKKTITKQEYYTQKNCPLKNKGEIKTFPNKNWGSSLPQVLPYKKCLREFFKLKWNYAKQQHESNENLNLTGKSKHIDKYRIM